MSYTVFARRWRPQTFEDVIGQEPVVQTLRNAILHNRIGQAYLLVGPRGIGKTTIARIFAKALNCIDGPTVTPCGKCDSCREITTGSSFDVTEIDGASNNKVEDVHEIRENIRFAPFRGKFRVCYIDEVHMLSTAAFNALLKTLEEPPPHAKFIFATTEADKIPSTVLSRCQRFDLRRIPVPLIMESLRKISASDNITISEEALLAIARGSDGGMRDAQSALDQLVASCGSQITEDDVLSVFSLVSGKTLSDIATAILQGDINGIIALIDEMDRAGKDLRRLTAELISHFRNLLVYSHTDGKCTGFDLTDSQLADLRQQSAAAEPDNIRRVLDILLELDDGMRYGLSRRTRLEAALIRAASASISVPLEAILRHLQTLTSDNPPVAPPAPPSPQDTTAAPTEPPAPAAAGPVNPPPAPPATAEPATPYRGVIDNPAIASRDSVKLALDTLNAQITSID